MPETVALVQFRYSRSGAAPPSSDYLVSPIALLSEQFISCSNGNWTNSSAFPSHYDRSGGFIARWQGREGGRERAKEEASGLVRWLRPDYLIPRFGTTSRRPNSISLGGHGRRRPHPVRAAPDPSQ